MNATPPGPSGWPVPALTLPFPAGLRGSSGRTGPRSLSPAGSSPRELRRLFRVLRARLLPTARARQAPSVEFLASFTASARGVHLPAELPVSTYVPPSAFLTLSTGFSSSCLAGLFHPATAYEVPSSGCSPDCRPHWLIASQLPLDVDTALLRKSYLHRSGSRCPACRVFSGNRSVVAGRCVTPAGTRSPLEFSLSRASLRTPWRRLRGPSARDLVCRFLV